jgi:hypothetical protein
MQIHDTKSRSDLAHVGIGLTEAEARDLRDTLETLLNDPGQRHEHVNDTNYEVELTVWIDRQDV